MNININNPSPLISLVFGILILINPKLLSALVAIYLIVTGLIGLGFLKFF
ncbi:DUF3096 domain-containing protein [Patescibacteria group bacterium]|nr:DUF3096 domain-containing protein [Patescibacteria group bacterium]